jgi:hypothetical protein
MSAVDDNNELHVIIDADNYSAARDRELENDDIQQLAKKTVHSATIEDRHITLVTSDGWTFRFYGFLEAVKPGGKSMYDETNVEREGDE